MEPPDRAAAPPTDRLRTILGGPARWRSFEHHGQVGSTNDLATERIAAGAPPGVVIVADGQTAGRGRLGRRWEDAPTGRPDASLLVSVTVAASEPVTLVPLATGMAVRHAVKRAGVSRPALKWPNDVLVGDRKCAGVLVENPGSGQLVIGVGVDLDWRGTARDGDAAGWTSIAEETGRDVDRWAVLANLLAGLDQWLHDVEREPATLAALYQQACATIGREVAVDLPSPIAGGQQHIRGTAMQLAADGALVVRTEAGQLAVTAGDVTHLR